MLRVTTLAGLVLGLAILSLGVTGQAPAKSPEWTINATIIEACSCPMFCQCYFNTEPAAHGGHEGHGGEEHFCRFNNAFRVNSGQYGNVKLDGAKFWVAGDLGGDFSHGKMDWAVVTFDKSLKPEQREAIGAILGSLYPVEWNSLTTAEGVMTWKASDKEARATLDGGKTAEVVLQHPGASAADGAKPIVIHNLQYWGAKSNEGFVLMPNVVEAYRVGEKPFEFKGTNGFMITLELDSKHAAKMARGE